MPTTNDVSSADKFVADAKAAFDSGIKPIQKVFSTVFGECCAIGAVAKWNKLSPYDYLSIKELYSLSRDYYSGIVDGFDEKTFVGYSSDYTLRYQHGKEIYQYAMEKV